nr:YlbG family protein [Loigolactobacillus binensis]
MTPRQGLVVWVYSLKQLRQLRRYGTIYYTSRRLKYVYLYVDQAMVAPTSEQIKKLHFVRQVEVSHRPELDMNFGERVGQLERTEDHEPHESVGPKILLTSKEILEKDS